MLVKGDEQGNPQLSIPTWTLSSIDWHAGPEPTSVPITRDDIAEVLFTSGATSDPKGVIIQHKNVLANIVPVEREVQKYKRYIWPFHPIRFLNLLPLSHMFGQAMATFIPPIIGGTVVFTASLNPRDIVRLVNTHRISVIICVPKMLEVLKSMS